MHVSATVDSDFMKCRGEQLGPDEMHLVSVVRMNHEFNRERIMTLADLGVSHGMIVIALPSNKTSETFTAAVNEIKPEVIRKWAVAVGAFGIA
jgi:hypothetical protein